MARERMVTRTVENAEVKVMVVEVSTQKVSTITYNVSATIGKESTLKFIQKHYDTEELKNVALIDYTVHEILYGMTEQQFISLAKVLPPRTAQTESK